MSPALPELDLSHFARGPWWRVAAGYAALGAIAGLGQAPFDLPFLTFLSLVALFLTRPVSVDWRRSAWYGWAYGAGYFALVLHWIVEPFLVDAARHGWMAPFALALLAGGLALFWGLAFYVAARMRAPVLLVPLWVALEMLRAVIFTGFPWGMIAYAWTQSYLYQLAAFVGPYGVGLIVLLAAYYVAGWLRQHVLIGTAVALGLAVAGQIPLPSAPLIADPQAPVVRLVQPNAPQHQKWDPAYTRMFYDRLLQGTGADPALATRPASLIVWPETAIPTTLAQSADLFEQISQTAGGIPVVLGLRRFVGRDPYNSLVVLDPQGGVQDLYDKAHLVPFGEYMPWEALFRRLDIAGLASDGPLGYRPGPGPGLVDLGPLGLAQPLICYEGIFPHEVARMARRPDLLILITNDAWFGQFSGPFQHLRQAQARAIETGLPLIRAANTGVSAVIDPRGRLVGQLGLGHAGHMDVALPAPLAPPLYRTFGDWPARVALLLLMAVAFWRRRSGNWD